MNILAIGNSFSQDATTYLRRICEAAGRQDRIVNLYIPGCELVRHWDNICQNTPKYEEQLDGQSTGRHLSVEDGLNEGPWDVITLQQASHDSGAEKTYFPYITKIAAFVRGKCPEAKLWVHQTWAYEIDSKHSRFADYDRDQQKMYRALVAAYQKAAAAIDAPLLPCGEMIQSLRGKAPFDYENGGMSLCRDGFHLSIPYGRYVAAAVWYELLIGGDITANPYVPEGADETVLNGLRTAVHTFVAARKNG